MSFFQIELGSGGPPLVLLHGFLGQPQVWQPTLKSLGHCETTVSVVLPGHGRDPWMPPQDTFDAAIHAIAAAIPSREKVWVIGYSMGARVALSLALRHLDRVEGAVLIGCHPGLRSDDERIERMAQDDARASSIVALGLDVFVDQWEAQPLFATQRDLAADARERHRRHRLDHVPEGVAWAARTLGLGRSPSAWGALRDSQTPLLFVTGERDERYRAIAEEVLTVAPQVRHCIIPRAGHDVALEAPVALAGAIRSFISNTPRSTQ